MKTGLALYGGTFDPVHRGHLAAARAALASLPVDELRFVVAGSPPHKAGTTLPSPAEDRVAMVELGIEELGGDDRDRLRVDRRELSRAGPSYTVLTLRELRDEAPDRTLYFMIGADNWSSLPSWHRADEILELAHIVVMPRRGHDLPPASERVHRLAAAEVDVSSHEIRDRVAGGAPPTSLVDLIPIRVAAYIEQHGLYSA